MVIVAGSYRRYPQTKKRIKLPVSSISIIPLYCRSAPNNTMVEWEETRKMAAMFLVVTALSSTLN